MISRRELLQSLTTWAAGPETCLGFQGEFTMETSDSPFFEHFHFLAIPIRALLDLPAEGITVRTSKIDLECYDQEAFKKFIGEYKLDADGLLQHSHQVKISQQKLQAIAAGQKNVEVRVISDNGNYVHNILVTASPMVLATVRKAQAKKETP